ncbi:hypothetical protein AX16_006764 [Volvariella volvacea WC 439]|nr:hypothetical protein AX16_006764 [Volvariella volvacea WC 439]
MSTLEVVSLPPAILQDLLRLQGEELIRLRAQVGEYSQAIELLRQQLQVTRSENEELKARLSSTKPNGAGVKKAKIVLEPRGPIGSPSGSSFDPPEIAWVPRDDNPWIENELGPAHAPQSSYELPIPSTAVNDSASDDQTGGQHVSFEAPNELQPFCIHKGPWKVLDHARKTLKPRTPRLMLGENNFVFSASSPNVCFAVLPDPADHPHMKNIEKRMKKMMNKEKIELIIFQKGKSVYAGTYESRERVTLEPQLFPNLPKIVKEDVYKLGKGEGFTDAFVKNALASGEWKVVQIKFERVGFNLELNQILFSAPAG